MLLENDKTIKTIRDIPHTFSFIIRKRQQVDALMELPKDKRPPDSILWHSNPKKLENWLDEVLKRTDKRDGVVEIDTSRIEG